MAIPAAIVDLDNCISDDQWRLSFINPLCEQPNDRYWKYHERCDLDLHENRSIINRLQAYYKLIIFTSRPEIVRKKTERWLARYSIPNEYVFMRPDDNHMPSVELKRLMLSLLPADYAPVTAIDDRRDVLDMYRDNGIRDVQRVFIYEPKVMHP